MKIRRSLSFLIVLGAISLSVKAQMPQASPYQMGAYLPGIMNPSDYANPGMTGLIAIDYNIFFNSDKFIDKYGNDLNSIEIPGSGIKPLDVSISGYFNSLLITYVSPELKFLGNARYFGYVAPSFSTASFGVGLSQLIIEDITVNGGSSGLADLNIAPLFLTWTIKDSKMDITAGYMFTAPTGKYRSGADDNVGLGFWSHDFQAFAYYYLNERATTLYLGNTFETHSKIKDTDVKPGNRYILEYGLSQYVSERMDITIQGGHTMQVSADTGNDVYWDNTFRDRYSTIGAGAGYWLSVGKFYTNAKWWTNYGIKEHFKFNSFQVQLVYIPGL
jgi:hypothetical protein